MNPSETEPRSGSTKGIANFSAGPAALPDEVIDSAERLLRDVGSSGIGGLELSHRHPLFAAAVERAVADCRELAAIPDDHAVLFLQGGASTQFSMVAMNLLRDGAVADYVDSGHWSSRAIEEARTIGGVHVAGSSADDDYRHVPSAESLSWSRHPAYAHFTSNNTIYGTQWPTEPSPPAGVPLVCDASSDLFSRPIDIGRYGLIYAGAQKNLGPAGVTLVIVHRELVERGATRIPAMLQYRSHVERGSRFNTPNVFGVLVLGEMLAWIKRRGGLSAVADENRRKAELLYDYLDRSTLFRGTVRRESRSTMNVCFHTSDARLDAEFVESARARGMIGLAGHRRVGGLRASLYNAVPLSACERLVRWLGEFEAGR